MMKASANARPASLPAFATNTLSVTEHDIDFTFKFSVNYPILLLYFGDEHFTLFIEIPLPLTFSPIRVKCRQRRRL